jgi:hypothetical protein
MTSVRRGTGTSRVEVETVTRDGFTLRIGRRERFVCFKDFPWFRDASIAQIMKVTIPRPHHLHWPDLDIDLAVESLDHPERFPLMSRIPSAIRKRPKRSLVMEQPRRYNITKRRSPTR